VQAFFKELGPGLIAGAADDDPSGISTYSVAGAAFGTRHSGPPYFHFH
jgi:Mn2+/Fe2+ NRAMP family transporter